MCFFYSLHDVGVIDRWNLQDSTTPIGSDDSTNVVAIATETAFLWVGTADQPLKVSNYQRLTSQDLNSNWNTLCDPAHLCTHACHAGCDLGAN